MRMFHLSARTAAAVVAAGLALGTAATVTTAEAAEPAATTTTATVQSPDLVTPKVLDCGSADNLVVVGSNGANCFSGTDYYWGGHISDVTYVEAASASWVRIYANGTSGSAGSYFNLVPGDVYNFGGGYGITQVCDACGYHS